MANSEFNLFDELQIFLNLVKYKTAASYANQEDIGITTIWRKVDNLEKHLNTQLINRQAQGSIELTENGRHIFSNLFLNNIRLNESLKYTNNDKPVLYVLASVPIMMAFSEHHLQQIQQDNLPYRVKFITYSQMAFQLNKSSFISDAIQQLAQGFDIVYLPHTSPESPVVDNWNNLVTLRIHHKFYASEAYLKQHEEPHNISELTAHTYISDKQRDTLHIFSNKDDRIQSINITSNLTSNSMIARAELIKNGLGITHLPTTMNIASIHQHKFVNILKDYYLNTFYISIYQNNNVINQSKSAIKHFLNNTEDKYKNIIVSSADILGANK